MSSLYFIEIAVEVVSRAFSAVLMLLSTSWFESETVGRMSLAGAAGYLISNVMNGSWTLRFSRNSDDKISVAQSLKQLRYLFLIAMAVVPFAKIVFYSRQPVDFLVYLAFYVVVYFFQFRNEIEFVSRNIDEVKRVLSIRRLFASLVASIGLISLLFLFKNSYLQITALIGFQVTLFLALRLNGEKPGNESLDRKVKKASKFHSFRFVATNILINATYVVDNLVAGAVLGLEKYAIYAVAISLVSLSIGIFATASQRMYPIAKGPNNFRLDVYAISSIIFVLVLLGVLGSLLQDSSNLILSSALSYCPWFIPYAVFRFVNIKFGLFFQSKEWNFKYLMSVVFYSLSIISTGCFAAKFFGIAGMILAVDFSMGLSTLILITMSVIAKKKSNSKGA